MAGDVTSPLGHPTDPLRRPFRGNVLPRLRDRRAVGATGLTVSPVCVGIVRDPQAVCFAYERGVNFFFFSADMHWPMYEQTRVGLARLLAARPGAREHLTVAVVSYVTQPEFGTFPFVEALAAVPGLERIDLLVAGGVYGHDCDRRLAALAELRAQGFLGTRAIAASFHDRAAVARCANLASCDVGFFRFNAQHPRALEEVFPQLAPGGQRPLLYGFTSARGHVSHDRARQLGVGDEFWSPTISDHYRFALAPPEVDGVLCAPKSSEELTALEEALASGPLTVEEIEHMLLLGELERLATERRERRRSELRPPPPRR
jgi:hypothetical protein